MKYFFINLLFLFLFSCNSNSQNEKLKDNESWTITSKTTYSNFYDNSNKLVKVISKTTIYENNKPLDLEEVVTSYEYFKNNEYSNEKTYKTSYGTKKLNSETLEKYDSYGNAIYEMSRNLGIEYFRTFKTYNNNHQLIKSQIINQTTPPFYMTDDELNSALNTEKPSFDTSFISFIYDNSGKLIKELTFDNSNKLLQSKVYSYLADGDESYFILDSNNDTLRTSPTIINKNPLTTIIKPKSGDSTLTVYENKNPILIISHFEGHKTKYETKYDSHGNPIESIDYK